MRIRLCSLTVLLFISVVAGPGSARPYIQMVPESGIRLAITPVYESAPMTGFFPLRMTLSNNSGRERTWFFRAVQRTSELHLSSSVFTQQLTVPDQSEQTFEVYVPIISTSRGRSTWHHKDLQMTLTGYGIRSATFHSYASLRSGSLPYVAMSDALHLRSWPVLTKALEKEKSYLYGSKISPGNMPRQWRGYAGVWRLLITAEEWDGLPAEVRRAVVDWVLIGGELHLFHRNQLPYGSRDYGGFRFEGIAAGQSVRKSLGLGHVALQIWNGQEIGSSYQTTLQIDAKYLNRSKHFERLGKTYSRQTWPLMSDMPTHRFASGFLWALGAFLLVYFVLVGPFNVWRSAKRNRRLQLFFTTPVLAVMSSVILCVLLAFHAGFGAWGLRTTGVYLLPNQPKAMVMQEQITKTAFMLHTGFSVPQDLFITPIPLDKVPKKISPVYKIAAGHLGGDWFANNAVQAQFTTALQSTRAGVERVPGDTSQTLTLRSRIHAVLSDIFVRDENGRYWHGQDAEAGGEVVLQPVSQDVYQRWRRNTIKPQAGPKLQQTLRLIDDRRGVFVAVTKRAPDFAVETLPGIDWKAQTTVIFGHLPSATTTARDGTFILQAAGHTP